MQGVFFSCLGKYGFAFLHLHLIMFFLGVMEGKMDEVLGSFSVPLDGRFESVRTGETNLGNWVCDVILASTGADLVVLNSGTLRSDQVHPAGNFTMRDLVTIIPMMDPLVVISVTGRFTNAQDFTEPLHKHFLCVNHLSLSRYICCVECLYV
jgi:5''-nucleotidase/2'',3''-cyclic phosphodiesterase and related esterases